MLANVQLRVHRLQNHETKQQNHNWCSSVALRNRRRGDSLI